MKIIARWILIALVYPGLSEAIRATDHYVTPPAGYGTNNPPYTNWADAATNIQWAVNSAAGGDTIWVTNGTYCLTNQILITNNITVRSMNGFSNTLAYASDANTVRCFYVSRTGVLDGFTISNGHFQGNSDTNGGAGAYITSGTVQNCYFRNNSVTNTGGNYAGGGGAFIHTSGTVSNCTFFTNSIWCNISGANEYGSAILAYGGGTILNSTIISNNFTNNTVIADFNAAIYLIYNFDTAVSTTQNARTIVSNCYITDNNLHGIKVVDGCRDYNNPSGGLLFTSRVEIVDCVLSNNRGYGAACWGGTFKNCRLLGNGSYGAYISYYFNTRFTNCVIANYSVGCRIESASAIIENCVISNNVGGWSVSAVWLISNATKYATSQSNTLVIRNCLIGYNSGGADPYGTLRITNMTWQLDTNSGIIGSLPRFLDRQLR